MATTAHKFEEKTRTSDVKLSEKVPFNKMLLSSGLRSGLHRAGYVYPTVLQANAIPIGKAGIDLIVQSKSGTGKTLIFTVIILECIQEGNAQSPQALILAPTREIAVQIENTINVIGGCCSGFKAVSVIGGLDVTGDRKRIQNARVIVGTPGRVLHLIQNDVLNTSKIKLLVIDEADKMMSSPFREDFEKINSTLPAKKQMVACSATFCNDMDAVLAKYMQNPFLISTEKRSTSLLGIKQLIYDMPEEKTNILEMQAKIVALKEIFSKVSFKQCLIFANSQSRAESYCTFLNKDGWPCEVICGAHDQKRRLDAFNKFREFKTRILIATDLMARGIDSEHVNLVINLELSEDAATYLHRVGRAGRFGSHGIAISFVASKKDAAKLRKIFEGIGFGMDILKFPKSQNIDLWNFNDSEGERDQLGVFDVNGVSDCEKENINNNIQLPSNEEKIKSTVKRSFENDIKMLDLIDHKPANKSPTNRNGNLFSEFIEKINSNTDLGDSKQSSEKMENSDEDADGNCADRDIKFGLVKKENIMDLVCDKEKKKKMDTLGDIFNEFCDSEEKKECHTRGKDSEVAKTIDKESPKQLRKPDHKLDDLCSKNIPDDLKDALCTMMVTSKSKKSNDNIFDDFEKFQCGSDNLQLTEAPPPSACEDENIKVKKEKTPKKVIHEAIREIRNDIITSSESQTQLNSVCSFSEHPSSTSMQPQAPTSSDNTNYPSTSTNTSDGQTKNDLANISSLTEELNCTFISSDLNLTALQKSLSTKSTTPEKQPGTSSFSSRNQSSPNVDFTTDTASERNESGFKSAEKSASSGVVSNDHSDESYSTTSESGSTTGDSLNSDSDSSTSDSSRSGSAARVSRRPRPKRRVRVKDESTNRHAVYQQEFANWTQLYWNQVTNIQDYVEYYKYVKKYSSRYS